MKVLKQKMQIVLSNSEASPWRATTLLLGDCEEDSSGTTAPEKHKGYVGGKGVSRDAKIKLFHTHALCVKQRCGPWRKLPDKDSQPLK